MRTPRSVDLAITNRCNLRCAYCLHFTSAADVEHELDTAQWLAFFEELGRLHVLTVSLQGAEPLCRDDLPALIDGIVANRMRFNLLTNGTLIGDAEAAMLASTGRCDYVQVSVDGSRAEVHDRFRGEGSFAAAVSAIERLKRHGVPVTVRMTVHRGNVDDLAATARFLLDDLGLPSFSTNYAAHVGRCRRNADTVQLTTRQRSKAMAVLLGLSREHNGRIEASAGPLAEARMWLEMERARQSGTPGPADRGRLTGCRCTAASVAVRADGVMVPCLLLSHVRLGSILTDDLGVVWRTHPSLERLRARSSVSLKKFPYCRDCAYVAYCTGNCPALAYTLTGSESGPSPDACLRRFLEEGGQLPAVSGTAARAEDAGTLRTTPTEHAVV